MSYNRFVAAHPPDHIDFTRVPHTELLTYADSCTEQTMLADTRCALLYALYARCATAYEVSREHPLVAAINDLQAARDRVKSTIEDKHYDDWWRANRYTYIFRRPILGC